MLLRNTRAKAEQVPGQRKSVKQDQEQVVRGAEEELIEYDAELVKELIASGGSLEAAIRQIVTSEGIASTLQAHNGQPAYWAGAASLAHDPEAALAYLKEAADLYPGSEVVLSSLVEANHYTTRKPVIQRFRKKCGFSVFRCGQVANCQIFVAR